MVKSNMGNVYVLQGLRDGELRLKNREVLDSMLGRKPFATASNFKMEQDGRIQSPFWSFNLVVCYL